MNMISRIRSACLSHMACDSLFARGRRVAFWTVGKERMLTTSSVGRDGKFVIATMDLRVQLKSLRQLLRC